MIGNDEASSPKKDAKEAEDKVTDNFESQVFVNSLFRVEYHSRKSEYVAEVELKLSPPIDQYGQPIM